MSGIAGIIHFDGRPVAAGQVETMTAAMQYRGPDGINHWRAGSVALGHCMLQTTPESLVERQPLANDDGSVILVLDGRVDNWLELRAELLRRQVFLRTRADAELVLRAYEIWGKECLQRIDGDFALVIWDADQRQALCARDRMGNRPFLYRWDGTTLTFASDVHAILELPWANATLNEGYVAEHISTEWASLEDTFWKDVFRLRPASWVTFDRDGSRRGRYWTPDLTSELRFRRDEDYICHYRELLSDVVRKMSRTHASLACEVSGGLDSSAIFALAAQLQSRSALLAPDLEGYTLDFRGDAHADESAFSEAVSAHLGKTLTAVAPGKFSVAWHRELAARFKEFPGFPNWTMNVPLYESAAASGKRVILGGSGGDEWLGAVDAWSAQVAGQCNPQELLAFLRHHVPESGWSRSLWLLARSGALPLLPRSLKTTIRSTLERAGLLKNLKHRDWLSAGLAEAIARQPRSDDSRQRDREASRSQRLQLALLHHPFALFGREISERLVARAGLERRQPFWSRQIVEAAFATPEKLRRRLGVDKWLHRQALTGLLPRAVLDRKDKAHFFGVYAERRPELLGLLSAGLLQDRTEWVDARRIERTLQAGLASDGNIRQDAGLWALAIVDAMATIDGVGESRTIGNK
jgi:asparagine synthase (glutamine-hydrolysing)